MAKKSAETSTAPPIIHELVAKFAEFQETYKADKYNETQLRRDFLDPFFAEATGEDFATHIRDSLRRDGWVVTSFDCSSDSRFQQLLISLAFSLGKPVPERESGPLIRVLQPTESGQARSKSLSAIYSVGNFPLHTDTAHWPIPCQVMILGCADPGVGERETHLVDLIRMPFTHEQKILLTSSPFCIANGRHSFFSTILQENRPFVRYDPGCMQATTSRGRDVQHMFDSAVKSHLTDTIHWREGMVLIINNWRILHGRGNAQCEDPERRILRVYANGVIDESRA